MPHFAVERALQEKMMNRLRSLIAKRAALWVRQVASREAVGRPAPIEVGKPVEEAHPRRCQHFQVSSQVWHLVEP